MLTIGTFAVGLINAVTGIFGMNLDNGNEVGQPDSRKMFLVVSKPSNKFTWFFVLFGKAELCCIVVPSAQLIVCILQLPKTHSDSLQVTLILVPGALLTFLAAVGFLRYKNLIGI